MWLWFPASPLALIVESQHGRLQIVITWPWDTATGRNPYQLPNTQFVIKARTLTVVTITRSVLSQVQTVTERVVIKWGLLYWVMLVSDYWSREINQVHILLWGIAGFGSLPYIKLLREVIHRQDFISSNKTGRRCWQCLVPVPWGSQSLGAFKQIETESRERCSLI